MSVPAGDLVLMVRAGGFAEQDRAAVARRRPPRSRRRALAGDRARGRHRDGDAQRAAAGQRAGQRQRPRRATRSASRRRVVADDVLRQIPTFSLFRRTSSLSSHPTAQGVSLRGVGPSGVSRTLVLLDGVPFNDPFGGWVYWTRVPLEGADRIEVVDGSSSSLYGNYAMGGVINIITAPPTRRTLELKPQYGNRPQPEVRLPRQRRLRQARRRRRRAARSAPTAFRSSPRASAAAWTTTRRSTSTP